MIYNKAKMALLWGYLVELLAAGLWTVLLWIMVRNEIVTFDSLIGCLRFVYQKCHDVLVAGTITWVVILGIPFVVIKFLGDKFRDLLLKEGALIHYFGAYFFATISFIIAFVLFPRIGDKGSSTFIFLTSFFYFYGLFNLMTVCTNAYCLIWLAQKYQNLLKRLEASKKNGLS